MLSPDAQNYIGCTPEREVDFEDESPKRPSPTVDTEITELLENGFPSNMRIRLDQNSEQVLLLETVNQQTGEVGVRSLEASYAGKVFVLGMYSVETDRIDPSKMRLADSVSATLTITQDEKLVAKVELLAGQIFFRDDKLYTPETLPPDVKAKWDEGVARARKRISERVPTDRKDIPPMSPLSLMR